jgi:hypothetical protein
MALSHPSQRMQHGISVDSLRVNTVPSRPTSCPASPSHEHSNVASAKPTDSNVREMRFFYSSLQSHFLKKKNG